MKGFFDLPKKEKTKQEIKHQLKHGILFLVGYFSILVTEDMPEFEKIKKLGGMRKNYSEREKKYILKQLVAKIERII